MARVTALRAKGSCRISPAGASLLRLATDRDDESLGTRADVTGRDDGRF
ncbi:MAG: hypothetical protein GVY34_12530 [Alphaproteobacteria bacterium]|nr:hypothetical protein [Alphaproteobacteria bacterium]